MFLDLQQSKELLDSLNSYRIIVGVVQSDSMREGAFTDIITKVQIGVTNAELMFIHENGSPLRNLPKRPVLQYTIEWAQEQIDEVLDGLISLGRDLWAIKLSDFAWLHWAELITKERSLILSVINSDKKLGL